MTISIQELKLEDCGKQKDKSRELSKEKPKVEFRKEILQYREGQELNQPAASVQMAKPPYTQLQLAAMAILRAPNLRLSTSEITKWVSTTFPYYSLTRSKWRDGITSQLYSSRIRAFTRVGHAVNDKGRSVPVYTIQAEKLNDVFKVVHEGDFTNEWTETMEILRTMQVQSRPELSMIEP